MPVASDNMSRASRGNPKATGCPGLEDFGEITKKSMGYSQQAMVTLPPV